MNLNNIKKNIVDIAYNAKEGHIASSFSILDILYVLYFNYLKIGDIFVLSKGHASLGLYSILKEKNIITKDELNSFCQLNSKLGGHPDCKKIPGVFFSTGSLGHGLPMSIGVSMGFKIKKLENKIICLIGDGELNEGTNWESVLLGSHHKLNNLTLIIDNNHSTDRALNMESIKSKFNSFGWLTIEIDGHNHNEILNSLNIYSDLPKCVIANTIKGKGVKTMENNPEWHHKAPNDEEYIKIIKELNEEAIC